MKIDEDTALTLEQVQKGYHTLPDLEEMKRYHEVLGLALDDHNYVSLCHAIAIVQGFTDEMKSERRVTLALARLTEQQLTPEQRSALDAYMDAYKAFYLGTWGFAGPCNAVLREETPTEAKTRFQWEANIQRQENKA